MGLVIEQIKDEFAKFAGNYGPAAIIPAVVTAVNDDGTVAVEFSDESAIEDVRLKAVVKEGNHFLMIPKVGSSVLVGKIQNSDEYVLLMPDEITDIKIKVDGGSFLIERDNLELRIDDKFLFKNASENMLTLMQDFIEAILEERHMTNTGPTINLTPDSITRFNAIKTRFENLLNDN